MLHYLTLLQTKILVDVNGVLDHNQESIGRVKFLSAFTLAERDLYYFSRYLLDNNFFTYI
jgi:hypothetical protein